MAIIAADLSIIRTKVANIMPQPAAKVPYLKKVANKNRKLAIKMKIWLIKIKVAIIVVDLSNIDHYLANKGSSFYLFKELRLGRMLNSSYTVTFLDSSDLRIFYNKSQMF